MDGRADGLDTASSMESGTFSETPHSESGSSGRFSVKCPHYNPDEDVITRTEWIQERGMKVRCGDHRSGSRDAHRHIYTFARPSLPRQTLPALRSAS